MVLLNLFRGAFTVETIQFCDLTLSLSDSLSLSLSPSSESLGYSSNDSYFYAAILAVVAVHVVLALFVYVAWNEGPRQSREGKQD